MPKSISAELNAIDVNNADSKEKLLKTFDYLNKNVKAIFFTVNSEIGALQWQDTFKTVELLLKERRVGQDALIPHVVLNNKSSAGLKTVFDAYQSLGLKQFFLVRGDKHQLQAGNELNYGSDLIQWVAKNYPRFNIKTGIYADYHKDTKNISDEEKWLKFKAKLGVNEFISQISYNTDALVYLQHRLGGRLNITPSIMPVDNFSFIKNFAQQNSFDFPLWLDKLASSYGSNAGKTSGLGIKQLLNNSSSNDSELRKLGYSVVNFLISRHFLNFDRVHIFSMNNAAAMQAIFKK